MHRSALLAAASIIALCAGLANLPSARAASGKAKVLWNQNNHDLGSAVLSQDFSSTTSYNSEGADDFVIPPGQTWTITEVDVTGVYGNGSSTSENVIFYKNRKAMPGRPLRKGTLNNLNGGAGPDFALKLPGKGVRLKAGHYWLSVIANQSSYDQTWGWELSHKVHGDYAVWQNPLNGFGTGCTIWEPLSNCFGSTYAGDFMFDLRGSSE